MPEFCPSRKCEASLQGDPIPDTYFQDERRLYGDLPPEERFYSLKIGHEVRGVYDGVLFWSCPACGHMWPRFSRQERSSLYWAALSAIAKIEQER